MFFVFGCCDPGTCGMPQDTTVDECCYCTVAVHCFFSHKNILLNKVKTQNKITIQYLQKEEYVS